jgi:glucosamine kinase
MIITGVNGGGTKTEAICCDETGRVLGRGYAGPSNYHNVGIKAAINNISKAISKTGFPKPHRLCVALAAVNSKKDYDTLSRALKKIKKDVILEHDAYAEMYTETRGGPGIMVVAGTGSVVMGYDGKRRYRKCDMGWFLGDEGSGYFIGREGIRAAARMVFEDGEHTKITKEIVSQVGLGSQEDLMSWAYSKKNTVTSIAALSKSVERASLKGDKIATQIIKRSSSTVANAVVDMSRKLKLKNAYIKDGVFNIKLYHSNFSRILARSGITSKRMEGSAAIGAVLIAADSAGIKLTIKQ